MLEAPNMVSSFTNFQCFFHIPLCILLYVTFCEEVVPTGRLSCWKKKTSLICRMTTGLDDLNWSFLVLRSALQDLRIRSTQTRDTDFLETYEGFLYVPIMYYLINLLLHWDRPKWSYFYQALVAAQGLWRGSEILRSVFQWYIGITKSQWII